MNLPEYSALPDTAPKGETSKIQLIKDAYNKADESAWESMGINDPVADPNRPLEWLKTDQYAQEKGISVGQAEQDITKAVSMRNAWITDMNNAKLAKDQKTPKPPQDILTIANKYGVKNPKWKKWDEDRLAKAKSTKSATDDLNLPFQVP